MAFYGVMFGDGLRGVQGRTLKTMTPYTDAEIERERAAITKALKTKTVGSGDDKRTEVVRSHANTSLIFERDPVLKHLGVNEMGHRLAWRALPPWRPAGSILRPVDNHDLAKIEEVLNGFFGGEHSSLSERAINTARTAHAGSHPFSPWRDHIDALPAWDGVERIPECLPMVADAGSAYVRQTFLNFWLSIMMRVYDPGCQVDSMLVLHGAQGYRKTSFFRSIPPPDLPIAELSEVPSASENKDLLATAHEAAIALIDELDKLRKKADQAAIKAFVTGRQDTWRAPYGKVDETVRRQFVLAGTTNLEEFLLDATGNRRYWILVVTDVITDEYLCRERMDLLLAEARDRYRRGERLDYSDEYEAQASAVRDRHLDDPVRAAVWDFLDEPRISAEVSEAAFGQGRRGEWHAGAPVDVSMVSVDLLLLYIHELAGVNKLSMRDAPTVSKIEAAMDAHPRYRRADGRRRVMGKQVRKAWEMVEPPAAAPKVPGPTPGPKWGSVRTAADGPSTPLAPVQIDPRSIVPAVPGKPKPTPVAEPVVVDVNAPAATLWPPDLPPLAEVPTNNPYA